MRAALWKDANRLAAVQRLHDRIEHLGLIDMRKTKLHHFASPKRIGIAGRSGRVTAAVAALAVSMLAVCRLGRVRFRRSVIDSSLLMLRTGAASRPSTESESPTLSCFVNCVPRPEMVTPSSGDNQILPTPATAKSCARSTGIAPDMRAKKPTTRFRMLFAALRKQRSSRPTAYTTTNGSRNWLACGAPRRTRRALRQDLELVAHADFAEEYFDKCRED